MDAAVPTAAAVWHHVLAGKDVRQHAGSERARESERASLRGTDTERRAMHGVVAAGHTLQVFVFFNSECLSNCRMACLPDA